MKLVIAEKPDIVKAIVKVLSGSPAWKNGYVEQGDYCLTWAFGHLLELKEPEDYGPEYARSNTTNDKLPIFFENWELKISESNGLGGSKSSSKKQQVGTIGKLIKNASLVIVAGDMDDEGQLIIEELLAWHNYKGSIKRLNTDALNEESLKKALSNLMDNDAWHLRAVSAAARRVADATIGINVSRFFSNLYKANLSAGRVQSAALNLVVMRDKIIDSHTKQKYFLLDIDALIKGQAASVQARFYPSKDNANLIDEKIIDRSYLDNLGAAIDGKTLSSDVSKEAQSESAPLPFSITALKAYCFEKFGIAPDETLAITQALRMNYGGLITYNRSECRYLPENMHIEAPKVLSAIMSNLSIQGKIEGLDANKKSKAFNDKNINAHHAIIPTAQKADISQLKSGELNVYRAICDFYLAQFLPVCKKEKTTLTIKGGSGNMFISTSTNILDAGYRAYLKDVGEDYKTSLLDNVPAGQYPCTISNPVVIERETAPPKRYTDASLEVDMKSVAKYVVDPEIKEILLLKDKDSKGENGSIGTAATRSAIIASLKKRGFIVNSGSNLVSTELGKEFCSILPDFLRNPDLTARWWEIQQKIQSEENTPNDLFKSALNSFNDIASASYPNISLQHIKGSSSGNRKTICPCPRCNSPIIETPKAFGCSGYKAGCTYVLWKEGKFGGHKVLASNNKKITSAMAKSLISGKKVPVKNLISEKTGKSYDTNLVLLDTGTAVYLNLDFGEKKGKKS